MTAWRLWSKVDALYWLVTNSISIAQQQSLEGFSVGGARYTPGGHTERELRELRHGIWQTFVESGAQYLLAASNPQDLLIRMVAVDGT